MGTRRAEPRARRRPAAARPGAAGHAPGRQRRLRARAPARRRRRRSRPTAASSSSARSGCTPTSAATSRTSSTRAGCGRTPVTATRTTPLGTGLRYLAVEHEGRRQESPEEVARRARRGRAAPRRGRPTDVIVVVALQRAGERCSARRSPTASASAPSTSSRARRPTSSSTRWPSSSGEDVPRGLEFLLSRNRLNVAISRARCLAYLVCSPAPARGQRPHDPADAPRERALPLRRARDS